jgi:hypothetical protein
MRQSMIALTNGGGCREDVTEAAGALVNALRRDHQPPEQVLVQIKEILAEAGLRPSYATPQHGIAADSQATLYRDVIAASIRRYYDGDDGDDGDGGANR